MKQTLFGLALALALALVLVGPSNAQTYPSRPIRFIVPFAAGGGADMTARTLAQRLTEALGESVIVDNRPGASAIIGTEIAARSPHDGYTILLASSILTVNPGMGRKLPYDAMRDFSPVSLVTNSPHLLAVHPSLPARSVKELVALAKARPGQLTFASGSNGGVSHLSGEMFSSIARIKIINVPYRGSGQAVLAIVTGEVSLGFNDVMTNLPPMKAGRLRGLAVTSLKRLSAIPDLPTIVESGYPGFQSGVWFGVLAPARTPHDIIFRLNAELVKITRRPEFLQRLTAEGGEAIGSTPEQFGDYIKLETANWAKIIKEANIKAN